MAAVRYGELLTPTVPGAALAQDKVRTACRSPCDGQSDGQHIALLSATPSHVPHLLVLLPSWVVSSTNTHSFAAM
jgi:hypothetical protein